jgi:hypothetical protein
LVFVSHFDPIEGRLSAVNTRLDTDISGEAFRLGLRNFIIRELLAN